MLTREEGYSPLEMYVFSKCNPYNSAYRFDPYVHLLQIKFRIFLPVVSFRCATLSLTLRKEHKSRVSENRLMGRVFGPKEEDAAGGWRRLHNEEHYNL
jgi:hypothetical protein